ncbi:unnamed protein product, partial [Rhizoctonia solani]
MAIHFLVAHASSPQIAGTLMVSQSRPLQKVSEIIGLINYYHDLPGILRYMVHKTDIAFEGEVPDVFSSLGEPLSGFDLVTKHWPNGFSSDVYSVILNKTLETTGTVSSDPLQKIKVPSVEAQGDDDENAQARLLKALKKFNISTLSKPSHFRDFQVEGGNILNGHPLEAKGLPIGLFHPVFDSFEGRIDSPSFTATPLQLSSARALLAASQYLYGKETGAGGRTETLKPLLNRLLGVFIQNSGVLGTHSDGLVQAQTGGYQMIMEVKNEIGVGGCDPSIQGAVAYANYWGDDRSEWMTRRCCCPSMILAIAGPWMCILGGIMLKQPVIQPLTPFFWFGDNLSAPLHIHYVAKVFASLAMSLSELRNFYDGLGMPSDIPRNPRRHLPHPQHFTVEKQRVDIEYRALVVPGKAIYRAVAQPEDGEAYKIIVKFAESYNALAHRLLASMGLAPELLFVSSEDQEEFKVARRIMVVMKEVPYKDLSTATSFPDCVHKDVSRALSALHQKNMVFGDLRPPNILVVDDEKGRQTGAMLIDFDW